MTGLDQEATGCPLEHEHVVSAGPLHARAPSGVLATSAAPIPRLMNHPNQATGPTAMAAPSPHRIRDVEASKRRCGHGQPLRYGGTLGGTDTITRVCKGRCTRSVQMRRREART